MTIKLEFPIPETWDEAVDAAIERGVEKVAEVYGADWFTKINLDMVSMASGNYCIVGQLERTVNPRAKGLPYAHGIERLGLLGLGYWGADEEDRAASEDLATFYGFEMGGLLYDGVDASHPDVAYVEYGELQDRWKARIAALLADGCKEV